MVDAEAKFGGFLRCRIGGAVWRRAAVKPWQAEAHKLKSVPPVLALWRNPSCLRVKVRDGRDIAHTSTVKLTCQ